MMSTDTIACSHCAKRLPAAAAFCDGCGARVVALDLSPPAAAAAMPMARAGFVAVGRGMPICHSCGAIAASKRSNCGSCGAAIGTSLEAVPPRNDGCVWVQLRTEFTCRQCGHRSLLDPLDFDGSITCASCHATQALDTNVWGEVLAHAHAVGDLGGYDWDGRNAHLAKRNPYADVGVTETQSRVEITGMRVIGGVMRTRHVSIAAAPGHPLCESCGCAIDIEAHGTMVRTKCPGCDERAEYRLRLEAKTMSAGLVAVIGEPFRVDRPEARLDATSAGMVIAMRCPNCGAALDLLDGKL